MDGQQDLPRPQSFGEPNPTLPTLPAPSPFPAPNAHAPVPPTVSVVLHDEPKPRRTGLFVGVGLLLVALLGAGGFLLLKSDPATASYSLTAAGDTAAETKAVAFTMTMTLMGQEITADAETDSESGLTHVSMNLGEAMLGMDGTIEMIYDTKAKVVYLNSEFFQSIGLEVDTDWLKMDEEFMQEQAGSDVSLFETADIGNPLDAGVVFEHAKSVTDLGFDEIDDAKVKHYEVVVDTAEAMEVSPQLQQQFDELGSDMPDELTYDVYVDEANRIRRTTTEISAGGMKAEIDIVIKPSGEPIVIEVPAPADVTDAADLL